jgi:hypothetical protein
LRFTPVSGSVAELGSLGRSTIVKAIVTFFLTALTGVILSGCSLLVSQGGKDMRRVFVPAASVATIRKELGQPTVQVSFPQALPASGIPELVTLAKFTRELSLSTPIGSHEDYAFKGRVYRDEAEGIVMVDTLTFGAGELLMFPLAVHGAVQDSHTTHRYRVWYRPDSNYFAHVELLTQQKESK